jgi:hypothetical protein
VKWVIFALAITAVLPFGMWLRRRPHLLPTIFAAMPLLVFYGLDSLDINVISYEDYRGDARGIEVTIVDLLLGASALALPRASAPAPYRLPRWAYMAAVLVSAALSPVLLYSSFSVWKLLRMYFLFAVTVRACEDPRVPPAILRGLSLGILYEAALCAQQRYVLHLHQTPGNLGHQNTVGMAVNLVMPAIFALVLERQGGRLAVATLGAGLVAIVLTLSRGAMTMAVLSLSAVYVVSLARKATGRKLGIAVLGALAAAILLVQAWDTIVDRFTNAPRESAEGRVLFEHAAERMLADHPMGVGINLFSHVLEHDGYGRDERLPEYDRSGIVHNVYWLTAAEVGYFGVGAYALVLAGPIVTALRAAAGRRRDVRRDVLFGLAVGLAVLYAQGTLEWALRQTALSYLFWIIAAMIAGISRSLRSS